MGYASARSAQCGTESTCRLGCVLLVAVADSALWAVLCREQIKQAQELELSQNADGSLDASLDNFDL